MKVFLGGTCNDSKWREELIPLLKIDYFNPVVEKWTEDSKKEEKVQKNYFCNKLLYVITPKMTGTFSIAEVVDDSNKRYSDTILVVLEEDDGQTFDERQLNSLEEVKDLVKVNGGKVLDTLEEVAEYLNGLNI